MTQLRRAPSRGPVARVDAAWSTAAAGTWMFSIALGLYAYYEDGPTGIALAVAVRTLPGALLAPLVHGRALHIPPRGLLVVSSVCRGALLLAIAQTVSMDAGFGVVIALAAAFRIAGTGQRAAHDRLLASLAAGPAARAAAHDRRGTGEYAGFLGGALIAGVVASSYGLDVLFGVCGAVFLLAAAIAATLPAGGRAEDPLRADDARPGRRDRLLLALFAGRVFAQAMVELLVIVAALDVLGMGQAGAGWLSAAWATGALVGLAAARLLPGRWTPPGGFAAGGIVAGAALALLSAAPGRNVALLLLVALGVGLVLVEVSTARLARRPASTDPAPGEEVVHALARSTGALVAAWLSTQLGAPDALLVAGLLVAALALAPLRALSTFGRVRAATADVAPVTPPGA